MGSKENIFESVKDAVTLKKYPFVRKGLPLLAIIGVSYYGMSFMTDTMMKHRSARKNILTFEEAEEKFGLKLKPKEDRNLPAEVIFEKDVKTMDIQNWENKRGPRPWEPETMGPPPANPKSRSDIFATAPPPSQLSTPASSS